MLNAPFIIAQIAPGLMSYEGSSPNFKEQHVRLSEHWTTQDEAMLSLSVG